MVGCCFPGLPQKAAGLAGWLLAMGLLFGLLERWRPLRRQRFLRRDAAKDIGYYFLGGLVPAYFMVVASAAVVWFLQRPRAGGLLCLDRSGASVAACRRLIVLGDTAYYGRIGGRMRFRGCGDSTSSITARRIWIGSSIRGAHPFDLVFVRVISALPILALGLRQGADAEAVVALYLTFATVWAFFIHANLNWRFGWLVQSSSRRHFIIGITAMRVRHR